MAKLTLADVSNLLGNPTSAANTINANNALVEAALEKTLSRDGTTPNQMSADFDMNNNDILNVGTLDTDILIVGGIDFTDTVDQLIQYRDEAQAAAEAALESQLVVEAIAATLTPIQFHEFYVDPTGGLVDSVTIPGGYTVGSVQRVYINGIEIDVFTANDGTTVSNLQITTDDLIEDETTVWVKVEIGDVLSGTAALDSRYVRQTQLGRDIGDVLQYEDFGGFPTLFIDNRLIFRNPSPSSTDVWDVGILRDSAAGGSFGFVNSALRVATTVAQATTSFEWNLLSTVTVDVAGGGEHVSVYAQAVKNADTTLWSICTELRETISNPTTGSLGMELGMFVTGTDTNQMRHGIDISIGSEDSLAGTNIVTSGIRIGPTVGDANRAQLTNGIQIKGRLGTTIDMSQVDVAYSDVTVKMPTNGKISWRDPDETIRGEIAWNNVVGTWQKSGVLITTAAPTGGAAGALPALPVGYVNEQINGTIRKIPFYG